MQKKFLFLILNAFSLNFLQSAYSAKEEPPKEDLNASPQIEFSSPFHDFGKIYRGQRVAHTFQFKNTGKGTLIIRSIHTACGCVSTRVEPQERIEPGQTGGIYFEYDSTHFNGDQMRTITIDTNGSVPPAVTLTFKADVEQEIATSPALMNVGEVDQSVEREFNTKVRIFKRAPTPPNAKSPPTIPMNSPKLSTLSEEKKKKLTKSDGPVEVVVAVSSAPYLSATVENEKIIVKTIPPLPVGPIREKITVWNNSRYLKELQIPIVGQVKGYMQTSPNYVEFGLVERGKSIDKTVLLTSDKKPFKISDVLIEIRRVEALKNIPPQDIVQTKTDLKEKSASIKLSMRIPNQLKGRKDVVNASGVIVIKTDDPSYKEIRVPFFGMLAGEM